ncbi:MAG: hypothetical protein AAF982_12115 [Pseudomonadota bacterium]
MYLTVWHENAADDLLAMLKDKIGAGSFDLRRDERMGTRSVFAGVDGARRAFSIPQDGPEIGFFVTGRPLHGNRA